MPAQGANQGRVWQVWQQVPARQVGARNVRLEGLAQVRKFLQMREPAREYSTKVVIWSTAVEQVAHVGEVAREQAQWHISGRPLLSQRQVSLGSVGRAHACFVGQVAQILYGGHQLFEPSGGNEVPGKMIPQVGFI